MDKKSGAPLGSKNNQHGSVKKTETFAAIKVTPDNLLTLENNYKKYKKAVSKKPKPSRSSFLVNLGLKYK